MKNLSNTKKALIIAGLVLDIAVTIFFFILSIMVIVGTQARNAGETPTGLVAWFLEDENALRFLFVVLVPLFVLLALNITLLVWYAKKSGEKKKVALSELNEQQKEELQKQLLSELMNKEAKPAEDQPKEDKKE